MDTFFFFFCRVRYFSPQFPHFLVIYFFVVVEAALQLLLGTQISHSREYINTSSSSQLLQSGRRTASSVRSSHPIWSRRSSTLYLTSLALSLPIYLPAITSDTCLLVAFLRIYLTTQLLPICDTARYSKSGDLASAAENAMKILCCTIHLPIPFTIFYPSLSFSLSAPFPLRIGYQSQEIVR